MASSRSPLAQMPFGYAFDPTYDPNSHFPYPSPPTPAPGPSLLDEADSHLLGDFFDRVGSTSFDTTDYIFDKSIPQQGLGDVHFGWADGLPPTLHGTTTSLPHTPMTASNMHELHHEGRNGAFGVSPMYRPATTSDDVLAAAALLQNGHAQMVHAMHSPESTGLSARHASHDFAQAPLIHPPLRRQSSQHYASGQMGMQRGPSSSSHHRANSVDVVHTAYPGMMYADPRRTNSGPTVALNRQSKAVEVRWGSDVSFLDHGYVAPPDQETEEDVTTEMMHSMKSFLPQTGVNPMSSPTATAAARQRASIAAIKGHDMSHYDAGAMSDDFDDAQAHARRKRKVKEEEALEDGDDDEANGQIKRRKKLAASGRNGRARKAVEAEQRERSQSVGQKTNRENLTEEQKRSNHILSEQKRRNLIKQGFDDLCDLVPDLRGGGYSKSAMLVQAADWLEDMLKGNAELRTLLASFDG
ncbi:MAG: hypothetical protein M1838_002427 [Thelocarpon superellum]|nr:MAG: hypothetical protein M1838_002427 [Thelocarpon superellum]